MNFVKEYQLKRRSPEEAAAIVKSGDWIDYTIAEGFPVLLDAALAKRRDELYDVKIRGTLQFGPIKTAECDPTREHFIYHSWHCSGYERYLCDKGLCNYIPMIFRNMGLYYRDHLDVDIAMVSVTPMDRHGYFNLSLATGVGKDILDKAKIVIVEINEHLPKVYGGFGECIHISQVDYIVEGEHPPLAQFPSTKATDTDQKIAEHIIPFIGNGSTLQLGIGSMPDAIGSMLAKTDLKDLGMHTELCSDAYVELYEAGKLTNAKKKENRYKGVLGIAVGTRKLYDWLDENPGVIMCPLEYVNSPSVIGKIDHMVSINSCIAADLYGQVSAESVGTRHISGTGGQLDYLTGTSLSRGGRAFICMSSTFTDKKGNRKSRIVPTFQGDIITSPRSQTCFLVTEYGIANLIGKSTWERAEEMIKLAHPDFRDELIKSAEKQGIWCRSNRR